MIAVVINQQFNQLRLKEPINHPLGGVVSLDIVFIHKNFNLLFSDYLFRIEPKFDRLANFEYSKLKNLNTSLCGTTLIFLQHPYACGPIIDQSKVEAIQS